MSSLFYNRNFENVGGLQEHIQTLKEMIIYPLLYRKLFDSYGIQAPRGVLFYGPPGTGKTLMAGAVAAECSKCCNRKVSFYMRKGGECLNKYVGESEQHLQNLFTQAYNTRPSIIFFDEIDGLVPTRSEYQEQVHGSVVSTLLALMDGLDTKPEVFVIGATNRIDMIDPALRRPGRFDRELYFPLPPLESRLEIFKIHTCNWRYRPSDTTLLKLAAECSGYCGADIQSLCSQAVMQSFNRSFPQALDTTRKHKITIKNVYITDDDFWDAKEKVVPASQRINILPSRPLSSELQPLLERSLEECLNQINQLCPFSFMYRNSGEYSKNKSLSCPRFLLFGKEGQAHISHIAPAVLQAFDHLPVIVMDLATINEDLNRFSDSSSLVHKVEEARQSMPSIIYLRNLTSWWNLIEDPAKQVLTSSLESLDTSSNAKIFIFGTATAHTYLELPSKIKKIFPQKKSFELRNPELEERKTFFRQILLEKNLLPPKHQFCEKVESQKDSEPEDAPTTSKKRRTNSISTSEMSTTSEPSNFNLKIANKRSGRLRNGKIYRNVNNKLGSKRSGKVKFEHTNSQNCSENVSRSFESFSGKNAKKDKVYPCVEQKEVMVDVKKLEELIEAAVEATAKAQVNTMVRLYEELEIVSLRYSSKVDRTHLPEELAREISVFNLT